MKTFLFQWPVILLSLFLSACSLMMDGSGNQSTNQPVVVENAQESTNPNVQQQATQPMPPAPQPRDQNTLQSVSLGTAPVTDEPIGGSLEKSMDQYDKVKMSRSLDKAPGKTTSWTNSRTGVKYEVTPVRKVVLKGNPYCRTYQMVATRGNSAKEVSGTACISEDGNWHPI